eukprot:TRINITY_DN3696_c0_g2_i1.p1 TRINITY_DN3696_c0_g2~~TRINITY_DN3696_c0_g2_i1.p1  ORF type:complete len:383 (+),score=95.47 TRINITY_DN3696_c0_g2_i1:370-1518(+)
MSFVRNQVEVHLFDLIGRAGVRVEEKDRPYIFRDQTEQGGKSERSKKSQQDLLFQELNSTIMTIITERQPLFRQGDPLLHTDPLFRAKGIDTDIVLFEEAIPEEERQKAIQDLVLEYPAIQQALRTEWDDIPILFTREGSKGIPGTLAFKLGWKAQDIIPYLQSNLVTIRQQRTQLRSKISELSRLQAEVIQTYDLDSLTTMPQVNNTQLEHCLHRLLHFDLVLKLAERDLRELHLIIGNQYQHQHQHSSLCIPHDFVTEELLAYLTRGMLASLRLNNKQSQAHVLLIREMLVHIKTGLAALNVRLDPHFTHLNKADQIQTLMHVLNHLSKVQQTMEGTTIELLSTPTYHYDRNAKLLRVPYRELDFVQVNKVLAQDRLATP